MHSYPPSFPLCPTEGGGLFEFQTPIPSPPRPRKVFKPVFLRIEILGTSVGTEGAENFYLASQRVFSPFSPYVYILKILRIWWRIHKWVKDTQKKFDPRPDLRVGPWLMGA